MIAFDPSAAPAIRSEWPPTYLVSEYSDRSAPCSIGALKHRAEQRVVAGDDRRVSLGLADGIGDAADHRDVDEAVGRIGRGLDQDH
ncbi:hypothetical protein ABIE71_000161 [Bradyrhizobium diazoefficiens]